MQRLFRLRSRRAQRKPLDKLLQKPIQLCRVDRLEQIIKDVRVNGRYI